MEISYSLLDIIMYFLLYSFLGWAVEMVYYSIRDKHFINRGFLNLPFALPYGIAAVILISVLPTLNGNLPLQYILCWVVYWAVQNLAGHFVRRIRRERKRENAEPTKNERIREFLVLSVIAGIYLIGYLMIHPLIFSLMLFLPNLLVRIFAIACVILIAFDFGCVVYSLRTHVAIPQAESNEQFTENLAKKMRRLIRSRLEKNYPGILEDQETPKTQYVFAEGLCFDKIIWVFLVSSFLGAGIEMVYCRLVGGSWMNRSSLLYGMFSIVWGLGAVILTITLQRIAHKADRYIFAAGFIVGGAYEYLCSVFTELVFGTVFWDYSHMPLNIGGRTNVLFCVFWGILAVIWIKIVYPPMSKGIEKIPALPGKILTWSLLVVMACDGILTAAAMTRYTDRQSNPTAANVVEQFLDTRYDDEWMEERWPNMKLTEE